MAENRKRMMDKFQKHLYDNYYEYCKRHQLKPTARGLIIFLIDQDLIPPVSIKQYAVLNEFETLFEKQEKQKTKTVHSLADFFNIPERTIWSILSKKRK